MQVFPSDRPSVIRIIVFPLIVCLLLLSSVINAHADLKIPITTSGEDGYYSYKIAINEKADTAYVTHPNSNFISVISAAEQQPASSAPHPPIVITKVDPWAPLRGLHDGVKPCLVEGSPSQIDGWAYAWVELSNTTNETLTTVGLFDIEVKSINTLGIGGTGSEDGFTNSLVLAPNQSCIIATSNLISTRIGVGGGEGNGPPPGGDKDGAIVSINYTISSISKYGGAYEYSTPALSDPYGDMAYWQLDIENSGKWIFKDDLAGKRNLHRTTLTGITSPANTPIMVNLTFPEEVRTPAVAKLELSFINLTTKQLVNNNTTVVYNIEYKGSPLLHIIEMQEGHSSTGSDVKYLVLNQTGTLDIAVKVTALNREAIGGSFEHLDNPEVAEFAIAVVPEFGSASLGNLIIGALSIASSIVAVKYVRHR